MSASITPIVLVAAFCVFGCSGSDSDGDGSGGAGGGGDSSNAAVCGNQTCETNETCHSCTEDCGACPSTTALCDGLVTDTEPHPMPEVDQPAVGERLTDPVFGTTIIRLTDVGAGGVIKPMYSTIQAWNADESLMILYEVDGGHQLYDGRSYELLRALDINPSDLEHVFWHTSDPDLLFYPDADTNELIRYHVSDDRKEVVHTFSSCDGQISAGADPMFTSWDSNVFGFRCSSGTIFGYTLDADRVTDEQESDSETAPQPAPSGKLYYFDGDVLDENLSRLRTLDVAEYDSHASLGRLASGHDTYNAVQWDPGERCDYGTLVVYDLTNGDCRTVIGESNGYPYPSTDIHVSAIAHRNPGWVALSIVGDPSGEEPLDQELVLADTNPGGKVCRVAHHHSHGSEGPQGYWAEPHVVISPSGTRLLFGSDWGGQDSVDAYVVELPSYQPK
jgi:hypothetical protein